MASPQTFPMRVVVDTREQAPYDFAGAPVYAGTSVVQGSLQSGDYSLAGFEDMVACERKSLPDLVQCLGRERPRFARELERARGLDAFAVVVEGSWQELAQGQYRSQLNPHSACQSIAAFMARMRVPFWFCGTRAAAEYCCWSFLRQWLQGRVHELKAVERMMKAPAGAPEAPQARARAGRVNTRKTNRRTFWRPLEALQRHRRTCNGRCNGNEAGRGGEGREGRDGACGRLRRVH